jgi:hypothetical protein
LRELQRPIRECHARQLGHMPAKALRELVALLRVARKPHEIPDGTWH